MATSGSGIVAPESYPIRKPTEAKQTHGRVVNPVRYYEVGGAAGPGIWHKDHSVFAQSPQVNQAKVEKATSVRAAKSVAEKSGE